MKNLLKFISIGLVMVLVLYSQISNPVQTVQAADDTVSDDTVEFMNENTGGAVVKKQSHYNATSAGVDISVYINDDDLSTTFSGTTTFLAETDDVTWKIGDGDFNLGGGAGECDASAAWVTGALKVECSLTTTNFNSNVNTVKSGTLSVTKNGVNQGLAVYDYTKGTFKPSAQTVIGDTAATDGIIAAYDYDAQDCYAAVDSSGNDPITATGNGGCGTGADTADQRVKITSSSDSTGEWVTIVEVGVAGDDSATADASIASGIFRGTIKLSTDASAADGDDDKVWVQDGDTLTVSYYKASDDDGNVGALIDSDEVTIDATDPSISNVSPADGFITNDVSPTITFTLTDEGSGFDETVTNFGDHVTLEINGCEVADTDLGVSAYSTGSMTLTYNKAIDWTSKARNKADNADVDCTGTDAGTDVRDSGGFNVDSDYTGAATANDTDHQGSSTMDGIAFSWRVIAEDEAGNTKTLGPSTSVGGGQGVLGTCNAADVAGSTNGCNNAYDRSTAYADTDTNIRIDTQDPAATGVSGAVAWDAGAKADDEDNSSVKITFDESLDTSTVTASDFTVSGTGVVSSTIVNVSFGGSDEDTNRYVYLDLAEDLGPNAKPKVKLVGSLTDIAGNDLKPATGDTSLTLGTASDAVDPTLTFGSITNRLLGEDGEADITFTSNENLTNTSADPNDDSAGGATGAFPVSPKTHVGCTCASMSGPFNVSSWVQSGLGDPDQGGNNTNAENRNGTDTQKVSVSLTSPKAGTASVEEGVTSGFTSDGLYGLVVTGRDGSGNNGTVGTVKVTNEDVSDDVVDDGDAKTFLGQDIGDADNNTLGDGETITLTPAKWPIADHDGDGEMSDSITGITVGGKAMTATELAYYTIDEINWGTDESIKLIYDGPTGAGETIIAEGATVKITYYYVAEAQTIEIDTSGPTATFTPADGESTTDTTPSIAIAWNDDEFAGDQNTTVVMTDATLTDSNAVDLDILGELSTTDDKTFYYKPVEALATGEYTIKVKANDVAGNKSTEFSAKITIKDRSKTEISMSPGWNLISLPGEPADGDINTLITNTQVDTVLTYDPSTPGGWLTAVRDGDALVGTLTTLDASHAYWVHSNNSDAIKVDIPGYLGGATSVPPAISVVEGWNLVPAVTLGSAASWDADVYFSGVSWVKAKSWDTDTEAWSDVLPDIVGSEDTSDTNIAEGKGYWLYTTKAGVIVP